MALLNSLNNGVAALKVFSKSLEVIGDNIANVNTTAFKASHANYEDSFSDVLQRSAPSDGITANRDGIQSGTGVNLASIRAKFTQGSIQATGNASDLAISGGGFFMVKNPASGELFATRAGDFRVDDVGQLMTTHGLNLQGINNGSITYTVGVGTAVPLAVADNTSTTIELGGTDTLAGLGIQPGQFVSGTGIQAGTTVVSVDTTTNRLVLSKATNAPLTSLTFESATIPSTGTSASAVITLGVGVTAASLGLVAGQTVTGTNVTGGSTVASFNDSVTPSEVTLSANPTGNVTGVVFSSTTTAGAAPFSASTVINLPSTGANATTVSALGLKVGAKVSGTGIPAGAYVTKIIGSYQVEISAPTNAAVTGALTFNNLVTTVTRFNPGDSGTEDAVGKLTVNDGVSSNFDAIIAAGTVTANQLEAFGFAGGKVPSITSYSVGKSGTITCFLNDGKSFSRGQVLLRNFADPNALMSVGDNLYNGFSAAGVVGTDDLNKDQNAPGNDGLGDIIGGSLELSNVDLTQEFSDLILTQRSFQAASRIITVCDSVLEELVNLKR